MKRIPAIVAAMFAALLAAVLVAPAAQAASWPLVRNGDHGDNVKTVQYLLSARGFATGADGAFGPGTEDKVKSFQSANGLSPVDGIVGGDTWSKLIVTVRNGDNSDAVKALQVQLNAHGAGLDVDGAFGPGTDTKVRNFQQSAGLNPVDGIVGPATWAALLGGGGSTGGSGGGSGDKLTQSQAESILSGAGITWSSSGNCSDRTNSSCTSFDGLRRASADGAVNFKHASNCAVNITGGTETGHASGTYSHGTGYKLDFGMSSCITNYIHGNFSHSGTRGDGADLWTAPSGNIYANEGSHWDVTFMN